MPTVQEIQTEALWAREREASALRHHITTAVRPGRGAYVTEIITLPSGGHVVGVAGADLYGVETAWTTVYAGSTDGRYFPHDDLAVLHLLSRKQDDDPNSSYQATRYAARVIGIRER